MNEKVKGESKDRRSATSGTVAAASARPENDSHPAGRFKSAPRIVFFVLCGLVFVAGLSAPASYSTNATILSFYELIFVLIYIVLLRISPPDREAAKIHPLIWAALVAWIFSVTISLFASPLGVGQMVTGHMRYGHVVSHVIFFIAVRDLLSRYELPIKWLLLAIPAASFVTAVVMAYLLLDLETYDKATSDRWFAFPPLNSHIRHSGYQVTAGVSVLMAFFICRNGLTTEKISSFVGGLVVLSSLWAFLFWMGGRGAILSTLIAFILLAFTLWLKSVQSRDLWLASTVSIAAGLALSELIAVFPWNGILDLAARTVEAVGAQDLNKMGTGRLNFWLSSWESVKDYLAFGLGPQGYWYMPNRIFGVQPHNFLVQFLIEWGLIGAVLFLTLLVYGFYYGIRNNVLRTVPDVDIASLSAGTMIVAITIHGMVDGTYYHPQPSLYLALGFAIWTLPRRSNGL